MKISKLTPGTTPTGVEVIPAVQGGQTVSLTASQIAQLTASALTKVDDTNITLTLGGTPATALLKATSITVGWTGRLALSRAATGTTGYALIGNGASDSSYQGFLQAGSGAATRTWNAKGLDVVSVKDFNAVGDGSTNDTTAVTAADAITSAKFVPGGTYATTLGATVLNGPYWGFGQIRTGATNKRAPFFCAVSAAPSSFGTHDSADTAFNGDISKSIFQVEHRITGAASLGQPATGYTYTPEAYPHYTYLYNSSGYNQNTGSNVGRTAAVAYRTVVYNAGQGDCVAYNATGFVTGAKPGATSFLANPGATLFNGDLTAGQAGVYLNPFEISLVDGGFDVAGIGAVYNLNRSVSTGALGVWWAGVRVQSIGSADVNAAFSASGKYDVGLDFSNITTDASAAAIALKPDDRIYGNAASSNGYYATSLGTNYLTYSSSLTAWHFVTGNTSALQIYSTKVLSPLAIVSTSPTAGVGYAAGAGGTVTQGAGSGKATTAVLNTACGAITMNNAALAAATIVSFTLTNSAIAITDVLALNHISGGTVGAYTLNAQAGAGSAVINVRNNTAGSLSEAIVIQFVVIKGVNA